MVGGTHRPPGGHSAPGDLVLSGSAGGLVHGTPGNLVTVRPAGENQVSASEFDSYPEDSEVPEEKIELGKQGKDVAELNESGFSGF